MVTGLAFAVLATVLNSVAALMQSDASRAHDVRLPVAMRPRFLVGLTVDVAGWLATVVALRNLPVFAVQAVLGGAIVMTAALAHLVHRVPVRRVHRWAMASCVVGLGLIAAGAGTEGPASAGRTADLVLIGLVCLVALTLAAV